MRNRSEIIEILKKECFQKNRRYGIHFLEMGLIIFFKQGTKYIIEINKKEFYFKTVDSMLDFLEEKWKKTYRDDLFLKEER